MYTKEGSLTDVETKEVIAILDAVSAHAYARGEVLEHAETSKEAVEKLSLSGEQKKKLLHIIDALLPDVQ